MRGERGERPPRPRSIAFRNPNPATYRFHRRERGKGNGERTRTWEDAAGKSTTSGSSIRGTRRAFYRARMSQRVGETEPGLVGEICGGGAGRGRGDRRGAATKPREGNNRGRAILLLVQVGAVGLLG
jgi:hypothetical protein